jgi:FkbM family methyltransferase
VPVTFKNGSTFQLTWPQFRVLRDNYSIMQRYSIEQVGEETFRIKDDNFELIGNLDMLLAVQELRCGIYQCNYRGKTVLDVGGFQGESAVYFSSMGAKKVIIYEPVVAHHKFINKNMSMNHVKAEIHKEGVGDRDENRTVIYKETDRSFGFSDEGPHKMEIRLRNVANVLEECNAEVAKFDCEGAEESLIRVPIEILRRIELYIIEVHSPKIRAAVIEKFKSAEFDITKETAINERQSIITFKRKYNGAIVKNLEEAFSS